MKADIHFDKDGWLNITLEAESVPEAAKMVRLGLNKGKNDGASVWADENHVRLYVSVLPVKSRRQAQNQTGAVRFQK